MSLYGSLFAGVSGLTAQGTAIGIISDNIANINTTGYKGGSQYFETLVTNTAGSTGYSPGGVSALNRQSVSRQGLLQTTNSATDIAISGDGFFVVNEKSDGDGGYLFSRAGSFKQDSLGNFQNASGYYLQAWPLDAEERLPGETGNLDTTSQSLLDSLTTVNIGSTSSNAVATTKVDLGLNLDSREGVYKGAGDVLKPIASSTENSGISSTQILVPNANLINGTSTLTITTGSGLASIYSYGGIARSNDITTTILGASTPTQSFTGATSGWQFTINSVGSGTVTFTYTPSSPNTSLGQFNNLNTLAQAIDSVSGLSSRVQGNRLYIAADDANQALTFANVGGGTFTTALGLVNVAAGTNRFATMSGLNTMINAISSDGISSAVTSPLSDSSIEIYNDDPLDTITFTASAAGVLNELQIASGAQGPAYSASTTSKNMASGAITPDFTRNVRVYDAQGNGHDVRIGFLKVANNIWATEVYAANKDEITSTLIDGQIATGTITFNGNGSLRTVQSNLSQEFTIGWTNGADPNKTTFNWGTEETTDGIRQFSSSYNVDFVNQNGTAPGLLDSVSIDSEGYIIANYNNGQTKKKYKIPLADFANPDGLTAKNGNVFTQNFSSGEVNLKHAGAGGVGSITASALEQANVELSEELTDMIVAQRAYQASSKIISTVDELLDNLNRI